MRKIYLTLTFTLLCLGGLWAQSVPQGINYQGVARDEAGMPLANKEVFLRVSLGENELSAEPFFSESHLVQTDQEGYFQLIIGKGGSDVGTLADVPWSNKDIWLQIELFDSQYGGFKVASKNQLFAVPYAFHAEKADRLVDDNEVDLRSGSSIYWTTTGNNDTRPPYHFLGTRDDNALHFKTNNTDRLVITNDGQVQVLSGVTGGEGSYSAYPLTVQGSNQGIYIKVNGGRSSANNFVTFADGGTAGNPEAVGGTKWGEIEGQTLDELLTSFDYIFQNAVFAINIASLIAQSVATGIEVGGLAASGLAAGAAVGAAANVVALVASSVSLGLQIGEYNANAIASVGVTYASGSGDYAEWLLRDPESRDLSYGEIVGIHAGKVSLETEGADHYLVVSMRPIVLGNAPQEDQEALYEKIAFMGQVPVRVSGPVALGDYIVPSGNNDGVGIAVHPDDMKAGDYHRIIGVAWEEAPNQPLNFVNVAVGINANDLSQKVEKLNHRVDNIMGYLEGKEPLKSENELSQALITNSFMQPQTTMTKGITDEQFDQFVGQNEGFFKMAFQQAGEQLKAKGYNLDRFPGLEEIINDPIPFMKKIRRDPNYATQWARVDMQIKGNEGE
jgi:hypothetical protein